MLAARAREHELTQARERQRRQEQENARLRSELAEANARVHQSQNIGIPFEVPDDDIDIDEQIRAYNRLTASRRQESNVNPEDKTDPGLARECSVCMDAPVQVVLVPCGHTGLCGACATELETCPICRVVIQTRTRIHLV
jgi:hypothetical protein